MIFAGIDIGVQNTKAVIVKDKRIIGKATVSSGGADRPLQIQKAFEEALSDAKITAADVEKISVTGKGKYDVPFANETFTETVAAVRAAKFYNKNTTAVLSVGADETLAAAIGEKRLVEEFVLNQKCTAGLGIFIEYLAKKLNMTTAQVSEANGPDAGVMNDGCVVFSELDALSLINNGASKEAVMATANRAVATRAATVLEDLTAPYGDKVTLIGGLAKNNAFVSALEAALGLKFVVPEDAEYCGAIGAVMCSIEGIQVEGNKII